MHAICKSGSIRMDGRALLATQQHSSFSLMPPTTPLSVRVVFLEPFI